MLEQLSGIKKVLNYSKRVMEDVKYRKSVSRDEVGRIIADRISKNGYGNVVLEYLVKWKGLSYAEATWYADYLWSCIILFVLLTLPINLFIDNISFGLLGEKWL
ncbi:hypothetical protein FXO37_09357, partial [Capsicum annuum]